MYIKLKNGCNETIKKNIFCQCRQCMELNVNNKLSQFFDLLHFVANFYISEFEFYFLAVAMCSDYFMIMFTRSKVDFEIAMLKIRKLFVSFKFLFLKK